MRRKWPAVLLFALALAPFARADEGDLKKAGEAYKKQDYKAARDHAAGAVKADPKQPDAHLLLGLACLGLRENQAAADALTELIKLNPKLAFAYDRRGDAHLKLGKFKEAVEDFDAVLGLEPQSAPEHWRRGIALYYAGRYADGVRQFETHRTANPEDVENAVWHYLCNAKATDRVTARKQLIPVRKDARVPMKEVWDLFAGKLKPADVLAAAEKVPADTDKGSEARFYAHLYLALYYEAEADAKKVIEHLTPAVEKYKIGHYMWDVANAHLAKLKVEKK
ncbi:MAG TPA: tetratricopeptide repeat protein [Fimbriiglobus sp.]|nr:tetratricopeptide repeat protein [Fimbriiglobus sp.]